MCCGLTKTFRLKSLKIAPFLTLIAMSYKSKKNTHLKLHQGTFFIRPNELPGCHINPIDVNFHLQKCLEFFDENSAEKI